MTDDAFGSAADGSVTGGQDTEDLEEDVAQEPTTQLNVEIPESLKRRLRMEKARTGKAIKDIVADVLDANVGS